MIFQIENGRSRFWQWDLNQRVIVNNHSITEVHYYNGTTDYSLVTKVYMVDGVRYSDVPNIFLQTTQNIHIYAVNEDHTKCERVFKVLQRPKPTDYVYTETEVATWSAFEAHVENELSDMKTMISAIPKFEIVVVDELPTEGRSYTIYLVTSEPMDNNLYTEYIFIDGKWELLGSAAVNDLDLTNYVKKTDIAGNGKLGIVKIDSAKGVSASADGTLSIQPATDPIVQTKSNNYYPLTSRHIDLLVKLGVTTNKNTLTDDEKTAAKEWLGVSDHAASADYATSAGNADSAKTAENATTANSAITANSALRADNATNAGNANHADVSDAVSSPNGKKATLPNLAEDAVLAVIGDIVDALVNYYTKNDTYNRDEVDERISAIPKFAIEVVSTLPTSGISPTTVYLVSDGTETDNIYKEYINVNGQWEKLGEQKVDLTGYATEEYVQGFAQPIGNYALKSEIPTVPVQSVNGKTGAVSLTAADVNAQPVGNYALKSEIPNVPVQSVNGKTGAVQLGAGDVGAVPISQYITITGVDENGTSHSWKVYGAKI